MDSRLTFLRRGEVEARVGFRRSFLYALIAAGQFPRPVRIGRRAVAWVSEDIDQWIEARIRESRP
jgi:prophage regulatory protein